MVDFLKDIAYLWMEFPFTTLILTVAAVFWAYVLYRLFYTLKYNPDLRPWEYVKPTKKSGGSSEDSVRSAEDSGRS